MIQIIFGWPGIISFIALASIAAWLPKPTLMIVALFLSLPSAYYLFGGNGWIQVAALYVPISLLACVWLLLDARPVPARLLLLPIYALYGWLGSAVYLQ